MKRWFWYGFAAAGLVLAAAAGYEVWWARRFDRQEIAP